MKKLVLVFIVSFSFICLWGLIESNPSGGTWNDGNSWIGGLVPSPEDDVLITSNIVINVDASCHNFTISSSGLIQNSYGDHRQFTINGNLSNAGFIKNNPNGYYLFVYVKGNVENSGFILNYELAFLGEEAQYFTNSGSLSPAYLIDNYPNSSVILLSDISTNNTIIDFNNDRLVLNSASGTFNLSMSGGYMIDTILEGGNGATLSMTGGCYLENSYADEIVFNGTIIIKDNVVIDYLINQATVYNYFGDNRTFTINQRLDNYGIICNNPTAYLLFVNIAGDVNNYGTIRSNKIYLTGAAQHKLYQSDSYHSFNCNNFIVSGEGSTKALSNIYFLNCEINLNNTTMILHNEDNSYGLYLDSGKLLYAILEGGTASVLNLVNNAYLSNVSMDDFIWQGTVIIENNVSINNLINQATVYNYSGDHRTLTINQRLDNYETICNSPNTHWLFLTIAGDLYNYGTIFNYQINLISNTQHILLVQDENHSIACSHFYIDSVGISKALSDLYYANCEINLNGTIMMLYDEDNSYSLYINGGKLLNATLDGGTASILNLENNAYLSNVTMDDFIWQGTVIVENNVIINNLINQATVYNYSDDHHTLTINQRLDNYGTIRNNLSAYYIYINLGGDLYNYGTIVNHKINLLTLTKDKTGVAAHLLYQDNYNHSFNCSYFYLSPEKGCKALSDLYYTNCEINLNNGIMQLYNGSNSYGLYLNGGKLTYANLDGGTESVLKLENNAYLSNVTMDDFIWQGTVIIENNVSINNLINQATVYNYSGNHRTLTINQRLDNYGTICNSPNTHWIFLTIAGDLYNYSSIFNYQITMNGTQDQHFQHMADSSINVNYFTLVSDVGAAFWYYNNSLTPYNSSPTNSININPTQYGTWQPRNPETGESGRHIIISTGEAHIDTPTAFTIYTDNGIPKLRWNKVSNALFYHLFVSTTPEGLSTVTPITIYDTDLSDNIVTVDLEGVEPIQFYRVTAGY
ncbi:MAG TPA: hypothetical protein PK126_03620 [Candidatus Syntrophosphaera thermopropionivorans]|jgi:hypothetical protein|nr:hypothetical protein [Candidatus Syntrophosphaera thermopropionivorans]HQK57609.1 hypothetical protein [Candidatus Syntrophosphaera thermopropionivorans]